MKKKVKKEHYVYLIEQYYYPEAWGGVQLIRDISLIFNEEFKVTVVCGTRQFVQGKEIGNFNPFKEGIKILKIPSIFIKPRNFFERVLENISFSFFSFIRILFLKKPTFIFVQTNPPLNLIFFAFLSWIKGIPLVINAWDIYPDVLISHNSGQFKGLKIVFILLNYIYKLAYKRARYVISLGTTMSQILRKKGIKEKAIIEIPNWATGKLSSANIRKNKFIEEWNVNSKLIIIYSGNCGVAHDSLSILKALQFSNLSSKEIKLFFVAKGSSLPKAKKFVKDNALEESVIFKKLVSPEYLSDSLGIADLALVTIRDKFEGLVVPSKVASYLARGLPILYIGPKSEISEIIEKANCGFWFKNYDIEGISNLIKTLSYNSDLLKEKSLNSRIYYNEILSFSKARKRFRNLIINLKKNKND